MKPVQTFLAIILLFVLVFTDLTAVLPVMGQSAVGEVGKLLSPPGAKFESYYDPVALKITELREKGLNDSQIVIELEKVGMHWDPKTNITSTGTPITLLPNDPHNGENSLLTYVQKGAGIATWYHYYNAYYCEMRPGSGEVAAGETDLRYVTIHLGYEGFMVEAGFKRDVTNGWDFFSNFETTENGEPLHHVLTHRPVLGQPNPNQFYRFYVDITNVQNASGWYKFDIYIDGEKIRTDYLPWRSNYAVDDALEISNNQDTPSCVWSNDNLATVHRDQYVRTEGDYWWNWNNAYVPTQSPWCAFPIHYTLDASSGTYTLTTWSGFADQYEDTILASSRWYELEANGGVASEYGNALRVSRSPGGSGWGQAGYVTKTTYNMDGAETKVEVSDFNELEEMSLQICLSQTTNSDPFNQNDWYRITKHRPSGNIYIQKKISGTLTTLRTTPFGSSTGYLKIDVESNTNTIKFLDGDSVVYSETYGLSSKNCYIYTFCSSYATYTGTDVFDNFEYFLFNPS
jgi:hypothetical protein